MNYRLKAAMMMAVLGVVPAVQADDKVQLNDVTAQDLLKLLVDEGVIDKAKLAGLAKKINERKSAATGAAVESVDAAQRDLKPAAEAQVVRVPYVPQYIKDEIRDQVRIGLKEDVSRDVLAQAKTERWGLPGVLPEWVDRIKLSGDIRLRSQQTFYGSSNREFDYYNLPYVNSKGGFPANDGRIWLNTTDDQNIFRARFRLGLKAKVSNEIEIGARLVTGNQTDPISTNQTLGNYGQKWDSSFDLGYLKYANKSKSVSLTGGRFENPFYSTDLVWDSDLTFEGLTGSWWPLRSDSMDEDFRSFDPFVTVGAFPLQEVSFTPEDKWLYAAQAGFVYDTNNQSKFTMAASYYSYKHIVGQRNAVDDKSLDWTAPAYMAALGNTMFNIRNDAVPSLTSMLFAHASDYQLMDVFAEYDIANFAPVHVILTLDYVKNLGFDKSDVADRLGFEVDGRTTGYQGKVAVGWPTISKARDWQVAFIYRYLERDAVPGEFTDSDFHGGGTDSKGYTLKFDYGIATNTWLTLRWLSSNEIDGDAVPAYGAIGQGRFGLDTLQLDINSKF